MPATETTVPPLTADQLQLLKQHGWKWAKTSGGTTSTDTVGPECIRDVKPTPDGFTVRYNAQAVFLATTAVVERIEWPPDLEKTWIFVYWRSIEDARRPAPEVN